MLHLPLFFSREADPEDAISLVVICEELTDEEAREYADGLSREEAREHLNVMLMEEP